MLSVATPTRGRWFQFSLATLLVVVTLVALVVREVNVVKHRRAAITYIQERGGHPTLLKDWEADLNPPGEYAIPVSPDASIPFWRRWMGDAPVAEISWNASAKEEDIERASAAFPEAGRYLIYPPPPQSP